MVLPVLRFANIFLATLIAGAMFVIWIGYGPMALAPSTYVEQQQNAIRAFWTELRDQWLGFHRLRAITGLAALALITWAGIKRQ